MPDTMVKTMQGDEYNVLNLQGKPYAPVNQRVESAHKHGGYTMLSCEYKEIFNKQVCEVWIEYDGKKFCGTAEIKKDFARPLEDGQTSAVGRALGFAGFDIERAIASKEDIDSAGMAGATVVESEAPRQLPQRSQPVKVTSKVLPNARPMPLLIQEANKHGLVKNVMVERFEKWTGKPWKELNSTLDASDVDAVQAGLAEFIRDNTAEAHNGHMEALHSALAAHPAD